MRLLKPLLTLVFAAAAIIAGLMVTLVVSVVGGILYLVARLFGGKISFQTNLRRGRRNAPERAQTGDVIDVTATPVSAEPIKTLPASHSRET